MNFDTIFRNIERAFRDSATRPWAFAASVLIAAAFVLLILIFVLPNSGESSVPAAPIESTTEPTPEPTPEPAALTYCPAQTSSGAPPTPPITDLG